MTRATISLPTPLSPVMSTLASHRAAQSASSSTLRVASLTPIMADCDIDIVRAFTDISLNGPATKWDVRFSSVAQPKVSDHSATPQRSTDHNETRARTSDLSVIVRGFNTLRANGGVVSPRGRAPSPHVRAVWADQ